MDSMCALNRALILSDGSCHYSDHSCWMIKLYNWNGAYSSSVSNYWGKNRLYSQFHLVDLG